MSFYPHFKRILEERLRQRASLESIVDAVRNAARHGKVALYPTNKINGLIFKKLRDEQPSLVRSVFGSFDKNPAAVTEPGLQVFDLRDLDRHRSEIALLIVTSSTYYETEMRDLRAHSKYDGEILKTSAFELNLDMRRTSPEALLGEIESIYHVLADEKSKATYMAFWLSWMLNDKQLTYLFETEEDFDLEQEPVNYKGYRIENVAPAEKNELLSEIYNIRQVHPEPGDVVFDIGAYKGDTACFFAHHVGKKGKVFAFEPVRPNYETLKATVQANGLQDIIVPVNAGIADKPGFLYSVSASDGSPWAYLSSEGGRGEKVEVTTIDEFVRAQGLARVDFIKADVEGLEEKVLSGASRTLKEMTPKVAFSMYHRTLDLIDLPKQLLSLGDYDVYAKAKVAGAYGLTMFGRRRGSR